MEKVYSIECIKCRGKIYSHQKMDDRGFLGVVCPSCCQSRMLQRKTVESKTK